METVETALKVLIAFGVLLMIGGFIVMKMKKK